MYFSDFDTHLSRVREVFSRLRDAGLKFHAMFVLEARGFLGPYSL